MLLAPWRSLLTGALHRNRSLPYARYVQLATVRPNGRPANRTLVFRGFLDGTNQLQFVTDDRSQKVSEIGTSPWGEVCWYFPQTREQFRIAGSLVLVRSGDPDPTRQQAHAAAWQNLSDAARQQFTWPHPGQGRGDAAAFQAQKPDEMHPLSQFCLLLLEPDRVDHLQLRGDPQNRSLYLKTQDLNWSIQTVNP
ncbi:pyridoxamine 5'-phosphate oxidase [Leptolyngbya sp. 'hensonii']|uniref:Npun_F5749 family FMN-dependent PPOX-type flavoprotein n=1 Tax=Leptolyngbya sp. 'hensonii' TaxID=1922337 RepID=UPI00094FAE99|nr:Npun_F5749 family FMN-dependent PPOX-type flavoprotein [Leptolyngbya sp. 'hensonii']OLP19377.1 pyridoxamine 5'-phosphate oxidase [Leptolyngbya sp. 'hensonii']